MFTAYGAGGIFGPFLAAWLMRDAGKIPYQALEGGNLVEKSFAAGDYKMAFVTAGILCILAAIASFAIRPPKSGA